MIGGRTLRAIMAEAAPRRPRFARPARIGPSRAERQRFRRAEDRDLPTLPRKEQAQCCLERRLPDGRPVIGFCSPECIRRPSVTRA